LPDRCTGAALFADISGFTPLARAFVADLGAKRGAKALLEVLNPLFALLIDPVHHTATNWPDARRGVDGERWRARAFYLWRDW